MKSKQNKRVSIFLAAALLMASPIFALDLFGKNKKKEETEPAKSRNFISFDDATYNTSPDKRIGAKIIVDTNSVGPSIAALTHLTYLPGAHVPSHRHVYVTEILYVLEGNLTVRIATETKVLGPNATAFIPPKTFHELMNDSLDVVKFLQYYSPSGAEEEYRNWENPKTVAAKEAAAKAEAAAEAEKKRQEEIAKGPQEIEGPAPLTVPGSPTNVTLGTVKIEEDTTEKPEVAEEAEEAKEAEKVEEKSSVRSESSKKIKEILLNLKKKKAEEQK